jgi:hypothetical protein
MASPATMRRGAITATSILTGLRLFLYVFTVLALSSQTTPSSLLA